MLTSTSDNDTEDRIIKTTFDFVLSLVGLIFTLPIILMAWTVASIETRSNGFFLQKRVGRKGEIFTLVKIKTMKPVSGIHTHVTQAGDPRITLSGNFLRKTKIDELPQLFNVFIGQMSFVGPRPDVEGYADQLQGEQRMILSIRPGITGPASIKYRDEETLLSQQENPEQYNQQVIWPDKVKINMQYVKNWSLLSDIRYIYQTIVGE